MNNNPNNELNDFLNKSKQNLINDFEKDAFEGFESLQSIEDAIELKASLDKKIAPLFAQKKQNYRVIWYAAAGLLLVIGLTVFFIQTNSDSITGNKNVSLVDIPKKESIETKSETESIINPPAESKDITLKAKDEEKSEGKSKSAKDQISDTKKVTDLTPKEEALKSAELEADNRAYKQEEKSGLDKMALAEGNAQTKASSNKGAGDDNLMKDEVTTTTKSSPVTVGGVTAREVAKPQKEKEEDKKVFETSSAVAANNKSNKDFDSEDFEGKESNLNKRDEKVASGKKSKDRKKSKAEVNQPPAVSSEKNNAPGFYKSDEATKTTVEQKSEANQCYYAGGETTLIKDVAEKLNSKNVNKKFNAVLFINEKRQVEKVNFTNSFDLNSNDKKAIETELKTLSKFNFYISPTTKILFEFKLDYRP